MVKLKVKSLKLSAGRPVAILHKNFAEKATIHIDDRVLIEKRGKKIGAVIDIATGILKEDEVIVSNEIIRTMKLKEGDEVEVEIATKPSSLQYIYKKLSCKPLNKKEIYNIIEDIVKNKLTEAEIAYFVAGVYKCGMPLKEIANLTKAILDTGKKLKLKGKIVDKHCLPGDTPLLIKNSGEIKTKTIGDVIENILEKNKDKIINDGDSYYLEGNFNNLNVLTWDDNYKVNFAPVIGLYKVKSPNRIFKITLRGNREISLTGKHTMFILKDGNVINISASDIKKRDYVLVPSKISEKPKIGKIKLSFTNPGKKNKKINRDLKINKELVRFLGYFLSEGFISYQGIFLNFGSHEKELIEDAKYCIKKIFNVIPTIGKPHRTALRLCIYSRALAESFIKEFKCGNNALTKKIPSFVFNLPNDLKKEFIKSLFKGDGHVRRGYEAQYVTVSKDLAIGLSYLLSSLNISSSLSSRKEGTREFPQNKGKISKTNKTYFIYTQAREIFGKRKGSNVAFINLLPIKEIGEIEKEKIGWEFRRCLKRQNYMTKQKLTKIIDKIKSDNVRKLLQSDISVLEVKKTKQYKNNSDYVYDLKTREGRFIAGFMPVCIHNSTGGLPGRTTPIIVSICSSEGLIIPKTSSRAITSASGTADAMEVLCKVSFSTAEIKKILKKTNACLVWGGSLNIAPADDKIIQVERLLSLDPEAQLLASVLAKKLAVNAKYILIDIPYGKNAKVTKKQAPNLQKKFKQLGKHFNIKISCYLQKADEPLGNGIGPALEIQDVIKVLRRESPCHKLEKRSLELSGKLLELTRKAKKGQGYKKAKEILDSGKAFKKFIEILKAQKGKLKNNKRAKFKQNINARKTGVIKQINIKQLNQIARIAGCPLDKYAGIYLHKHLKEKVKKSEPLITIYSESKQELKEAVSQFKKSKPIII